MEPKDVQRRVIHGHRVVSEVPTRNRAKPLAYLRDGIMHAPLKFRFHLVQLCLHPFAYRLPQHRVHSIASLLYADMRKAKKVERLRFPCSTLEPVVDREWTKFQQPRFLGMQFQVELPHSLGQFRPELLGIRPRERLRTTRGRCGSLFHFRMNFSFINTSPVLTGAQGE